MRVEPRPHAVLKLADDRDIRHSLDAQQRIIEMDQGEVAEINAVVSPIRRIQADHHQDVRRLFADGDPLILNRCRQERHRELHAVLHHHQGRVQVHPDIEGDEQRIRAVVAGKRGHIQHAWHAVDQLLDRRRHRVGNHLGARARIADGHLHLRRRDRRILRDRQREHRQPAGERDENRQHSRKDRPVDKESRNHRALGIIQSPRRRTKSQSRITKKQQTKPKRKRGRTRSRTLPRVRFGLVFRRSLAYVSG